MFENKNQNELVRFIYDVCYWPIYDAVAKHTQQFPNSLDLRYSRVRYPDSARLTSMVLQFPSNISTDGDKLLFDAVVSCVIEVSEDIYNNNMLYGSCGEITQWFVVSCTATVTDKLQYFNAPYIQNYKPDKGILLPDNRVSSNIVPIIKKEDLDREAEYFLRKYCPEALERPMPVPIENIAVEKMGLEVIHGYCLSPDFRVFGEISFANGNIFVYDEQGVRSSIDVRRGTILVDEKTFYMRSVGCVNNTIAHEAYHWHRHRLYSAVKQILSGLNVTAHRCKADITYPDEESPWTDKRRMEWQASAIAPRILMPHDQFVQKAEELYAQYNYNGGDEDSAALECIIAELASFYQVSKQSARIRLAETGHSEAEQPMETLITKVTPQDLFCEYYENERFREIIDSGLFVFADSCLVLDDEKYVARTPDGICKLTPYAREHMPECALRFSRRRRIISRQDQSAASAHDISFFGRSSKNTPYTHVTMKRRMGRFWRPAINWSNANERNLSATAPCRK